MRPTQGLLQRSLVDRHGHDAGRILNWPLALCERVCLLIDAPIDSGPRSTHLSRGHHPAAIAAADGSCQRLQACQDGARSSTLANFSARWWNEHAHTPHDAQAHSRTSRTRHEARRWQPSRTMWPPPPLARPLRRRRRRRPPPPRRPSSRRRRGWWRGLLAWTSPGFPPAKRCVVGFGWGAGCCWARGGKPYLLSIYLSLDQRVLLSYHTRDKHSRWRTACTTPSSWARASRYITYTYCLSADYSFRSAYLSIDRIDSTPTAGRCDPPTKPLPHTTYTRRSASSRACSR